MAEGMGRDGGSQAHGQGATGKAPVKLIGAAAALAAFAVTFGLMMSNPSPSTQQAVTTETAAKECSLLPRRFFIVGDTGGTVRFRSGTYLSPPYSLTATPQTVVFPLPRPTDTPVVDNIVIEGNASALVLTSDRPEFRLVFDKVTGAAPFTANWAPLKSC